MRIQYHSRNVNGHKHIWSVHNLLTHSKDLPEIDFLLRDIKEIDEGYWFGSLSDIQPTPRNIAIHSKLINECSLDYPIILCSQGRVMDGMHRICKALILGRESIKAKRFLSNPMPDYIDVDIDELPHDAPVTL